MSAFMLSVAVRGRTGLRRVVLGNPIRTLVEYGLHRGDLADGKAHLVVFRRAENQYDVSRRPFVVIVHGTGDIMDVGLIAFHDSTHRGWLETGKSLIGQWIPYSLCLPRRHREEEPVTTGPDRN